MPDEDSWTCPSCGAQLTSDVKHCPSCRVSRIHRATSSPPRGTPAVPPAPKKEELEVVLPCYLPEVRYSIVVPGGGAATWTSGLIYVTSAGMYFLSDKDGYDSEAKAAQVAADPSDTPKRLSPLSVFVPNNAVKRLVHGRFAGNFLQMTTLKIPLRLTNEGWARLVGACRKLGCTIET